MSKAVVSIERPSRYSKQLASHLGHKIAVTEIENGWHFEIDGAKGDVVTTGESELTMTATGDTVELEERMQVVLQKHLLKFAGDLNPEVVWK
jgi:hypothetical protein